MNPKTPISQNIHTLKISISPANIYNIEFMFVRINYHGTSQKAPKTPKTTKTGLRSIRRLAGHPLITSRFMLKPRKMGKNVCVAWRLMNCRQAIFGKIQKRKYKHEKLDFHHSIMLQIMHSQTSEIKQAIRTPLTWIS